MSAFVDPNKKPAPGSANPAAQAPGAAPNSASGGPGGWTNLQTFVGAQSQPARNSVTQASTAAADTAAKDTAKATTDAQRATGKAISSGMNTGGGSAAVVQGPGGAFQVDTSHVNLGGFAGPTAADIGNQYGQQIAGSQVQAADASAALHAGQVAANPYDNALARTGGGWGALRSAVAGQQNAADAQAAAIGSLQERSQFANRRSDQARAAGQADVARATNVATKRNDAKTKYDAAVADAQKREEAAKVKNAAADKKRADDAAKAAAEAKRKKDNGWFGNVADSAFGMFD